MQYSRLPANLDAYLRDIVHTANEAMNTKSLTTRRLCVRTLCAQTELLADVATDLQMAVNPLTKDGHSFDWA